MNALANASSGTNVSIPQLRQLQTTVAMAHQQFADFDRPSADLWGPLGTAQRQFDHEDAKITNLLGDGNRVISYALPFLGADGPRTYLIAAENNAEMRDEGSVLSYSLLHTVNGAITETTGGTVGTIELAGLAPGVTVPAGTQAVFGTLYPPGNWQSVNASADFAFSGSDMQAMFSAATGIQVDGVIGIDVVALQALLQLTGPVTAPGVPEPVTAQNASDVLLNQLYAGLPPESSQDPRREELSAVASAAFHQLDVGKVDVAALGRTLATEVAGRHLQLWDINPQYERTISAMGASGDIDTVDPTRTFHVAVENVTQDQARLLRRRRHLGHGEHLTKRKCPSGHDRAADQSRAGGPGAELPTGSGRNHFPCNRGLRRPSSSLGPSRIRGARKCGRVRTLIGCANRRSGDAGPVGHGALRNHNPQRHSRWQAEACLRTPAAARPGLSERPRSGQ